MLDTLIKLKFIIVIYNTESVMIFIKIKIKIMQENSENYKLSINVALNNAKKRINLLNNSDKNCIMEEYKEWINDGLNKHEVLLLREDPII